MARTLTKEVRKLVSLSEDQGFRIKQKKSGVMIYGKDGGAVLLHMTPSDCRAVKNARARLRNIGVTL